MVSTTRCGIDIAFFCGVVPLQFAVSAFERAPAPSARAVLAERGIPDAVDLDLAGWPVQLTQGSVWLTRESSAPPRVGVSLPRRPRHVILGRYSRGLGQADGDVHRQGRKRGGVHPQLHNVVAIAMTQHPDHRLRVILWRLDDKGQPRLSAQHGFTQLPSAVAFQTAALERLPTFCSTEQVAWPLLSLECAIRFRRH